MAAAPPGSSLQPQGEVTRLCGSMVKAALLLCLLAFCASAATAAARGLPVADWEKPPFCKDRDCPRFETVKKADGYETRKYEEAIWAWVEFEDVRDPQEATMIGVAELVNYLSGNNSESKQIEMGTPLARNFSVYEGRHSDGSTSALGRFPAWTAHVRGFEGWPTAANFRKHANKLMKYLEEDDKDFLEDCIYDPPTELFNRYNEAAQLEEWDIVLYDAPGGGGAALGRVASVAADELRVERLEEDAANQGVAELVNYLSGNNSESKQIEMGTPLARNFSVYEGRHSDGSTSALGRGSLS
ncbi:hypothetical protein ABPG75_003958 [Micractinium tetrahymenae]